LKYITDKRTLILCVVAANVDLTTSEVLKMARQVDPEGDRTLGILTKVDIMDAGTNCLKTLRNQEIKLKHGYIAVKNRSQKDINDKMAVVEALRNERRFFENHKDYRSVFDKVGTENLSKRLSMLLYEQIQGCLPEIEKQIDENLSHYEKESERLGEGFPKDQMARYDFIHEGVGKAGRLFRGVLEGRETIHGRKDGFCGLTKIGLLVKELHCKQENMLLDEILRMDIGELMIDIIDSKGLSLPGFFSVNAFEKRIQEQIQKLVIPSSKFIDMVHNQLVDLIEHSVNQIFKTVPNLEKIVMKKALDFLKEITEETRVLVTKMYQFEKKMIFTTDPTFAIELTKVEGILSQKLLKVANELKAKLADNKVKKYLEGDNELEKKIPQKYLAKAKELKALKLDLKSLVSDNEVVMFIEKMMRYFEIATKNLNDTIPKIVGANMVLRCAEELEDQVIKFFFKNGEMIEKLEEDPGIEQRRSDTREWIEKLRNAQEIFHGRVRSFESKMNNAEISDEVDLYN